MQNIGRYRIEGELGRGAMGVVHRAADTVIGRPVAIKTIRLDTFTDPAERERLKNRLLREARSAGLLSHPNIVTVFDVGEENGRAYIAMEYVAGLTLDQVLKDHNRLSREQFLAVLHQVSTALDYAHSKGVVHRDIKPGNLMLTESGTVKITDFGVAKIVSHQNTQSDMVLGTPNYMAPEQIEARNVDGKSDQFSLAVIAYELLTGERPFAADALPALLFKIVREEPAAPHLLNATLDSRVSAVLLRGLAKSPDARYSGCTAFAKDLATTLAACPRWEPMDRAAASTMATVAAPLTVAAIPERPEPVPVPESALLPRHAADLPPFLRQSRSGADASASRGSWLQPVALLLAVAAIPVAYWLYQERSARLAAQLQEQQQQSELQQPEQPPQAEADPSRPSPLAGDSQPPPTSQENTPPPQATATQQQQQPTAAPPPAETPPPATTTPTEQKPPPQTAQTTRPASNASSPPAAPPASGGPLSGLVEIESTPSGAQVRIDDTRDQCKTPCSMELRQGRHVLRFALEGHREGVLVINVPQESIASMRLDQLQGTLMVHTTPGGAQIFIDGQLQPGLSPTSIKLTPGKHRLTLRREGMKEHSQDVEVRDQTIATIEFTWQ